MSLTTLRFPSNEELLLLVNAYPIDEVFAVYGQLRSYVQAHPESRSTNISVNSNGWTTEQWESFSRYLSAEYNIIIANLFVKDRGSTLMFVTW